MFTLSQVVPDAPSGNVDSDVAAVAACDVADAAARSQTYDQQHSLPLERSTRSLYRPFTDRFSSSNNNSSRKQCEFGHDLDDADWRDTGGSDTRAGKLVPRLANAGRGSAAVNAAAAADAPPGGAGGGGGAGAG